jgi:hypothetical protein
MGNGALPHGSSYRAHPRLYLLGSRRNFSIAAVSGPSEGWISPDDLGRAGVSDQICGCD